MKGGDHDGQAFKVLPWERRFIVNAFAQIGDSALSVARGNGKSQVVAGLACSVIDPAGPLHGNRRHVDVFASSLEQGRIIYEDVIASLGELYDLDRRKDWRKQDTVSHCILEYRPTGARVRVLGSNPKRAHGLRSWLALLDEPAMWDASKMDAMIAAIRTGLGKSPGSRLIALGTRPASGAHFFSRMLDGGAGYSQVHAVAKDTPPAELLKVATIRKANPSWAHLPSLRARIKQEAKEAKADADALASFRSLRLNQGVSETIEALLLGADTWLRIEAKKPVERSGRYALGLDLGSTAAMSAAAGYWPSTGAAEVFAVFPHNPGLAERGLADGCGGLYQKCLDRKELLLAGQYVSDIQELLREVLRRWGPPSIIACDRYKEGDLREALEAVQFPMLPLTLRGHGFPCMVLPAT